MDQAVALVLSGPGTPAQLEAWLVALSQVPATRRFLLLCGADLPPARVPGDVTVLRGEEELVLVGTTVVATASATPTPRSLARLVAASASTGVAHRSRVLPHTSSASAPDAEPVEVATACIAIPGTPAPTPDPLTPAGVARSCAESGVTVKLLDSAAVVGPVEDALAVTAASSPPYGHPAAVPGTALHQLLRETGLAIPPLPDRLEPRPLLTVLTRTQGTRLLCLEETLTCLAAQTHHDFDVVIACHRAPAEAVAAVRHLVDLLPSWLRERTLVLEVERQGRSAPLNDALDVARGRYAVMLDDDDVVSPRWVAAFAEAESRGPGTVLRSAALAQHVTPVVDDLSEGPSPHEVGPAHPVWPSEFDLVDHLVDNASPPMSFAVPRGVFDDLGSRFDESLDTTEDWDFLMRAAGVTGVTSTPEVTATYRVWSAEQGSRHLHDEAEWAAGRATVLAGMDDRVTLLPPGSALGVRRLGEHLEQERAEKFRFAALNEQAAADLVTVNDAVTALRERIVVLEARIERLRQRRQGG